MQRFEFLYVTANSIPDALQGLINKYISDFQNRPGVFKLESIFMIPQMVAVAPTSSIVKAGQQQQQVKEVFHLVGLITEVNTDVPDLLRELQSIIRNELPVKLSGAIDVVIEMLTAANKKMPH